MDDSTGAPVAPDGPTAERVAALRRMFQRLGCEDDLDGSVRSELEGDQATLARYRFLSQLWPKMIDNWHREAGGLPAARRAEQNGASREDIVELARAVAYQTVFAMLYYLGDDGRDDCDDLPFWSLVEVDPDDEPTGRRLPSLFEELLMFDPSGREGSDIVEPLPGPWMRVDEGSGG